MISWDLLIKTFTTGSGFWNPLVWLLIIAIAYLIVYVIRSQGQTKYKKDTEQTKPFLSGNPEVEKEKMHVKASNLYWGFMESLRGIYGSLNKMHTGNVSDYVMWFIVIMGVFLVVIVGVF